VFRSDRLVQLLESRGLSQSELARRVGVSPTTIWKLATEPAQGSKHIHKIARALETTIEYLTGEADDPSEGYVALPSTEAVAEELGLVQVREIDLRFGMGATYLDIPVTTQVRHFSRDWLRQYTNSDPEQLFFAQGIGNSMEPYIHDSDLLLIDASQKTIKMSDMIWAVAYANVGSVRRIRPKADGSVAMLCDNPLVPDDVAYDGEMNVIGRVVAIVRKT